jgi:hypothetical protein
MDRYDKSRPLAIKVSQKKDSILCEIRAIQKIHESKRNSCLEIIHSGSFIVKDKEAEDGLIELHYFIMPRLG